MTILEKQFLFSRFVVNLITKAFELGYEVTLGEAWRPDETAMIYARNGKGIARSNHRVRLAIDLNLFKSGIFLTETRDYLPLGEWWEKQSLDIGVTCAWGGRFNDGNHFSFENNGVK